MSREVTFFFTDMEGSTKLVKKLGADYLDLLTQHNHIISSIIKDLHGEIIENPGDGYFIIFHDPVEAIQAATRIQKQIAQYRWPGGVKVKVRIAIHYGQMDEGPAGLTGLEINRTSRICFATAGGQVLISNRIFNLVKDKISSEITDFEDLGVFTLRDFDEPTHLFQLQIPELPQRFPIPRSTRSSPIIAVMPFENLNLEGEQKILCNGIAEEIIMALGRIPNLQVISRFNSFSLIAKEFSAQKIGKKLKADVILVGSIGVRNDILRVTAELIEVKTGIDLWSERYETKTSELFHIQDEIANKITEALEVKFIADDHRDIRTIQTSSVEAYEYYLRGRAFYAQFSLQTIKFALQMFNKAIEIDPAYALAYSGMADCYSYFYFHHNATDEIKDKANEFSLRSIELDPLLPEAYSSRGVVLSLMHRYKEAAESFDHAIELDPKLYQGYYQYARTSLIEGKFEKAGGLFEKAGEVQPEDYQALLLAGQCYDSIGWPQKAIDVRERGIRIAEENIKLNPGDVRALYMGANGLAFLGQRDKALKWLQTAFSLEPNDAMLLYNAGCIYALLGMKQEALNCLEKAATSGLTLKEWYLHDSNLDIIRDEPRFHQLMDNFVEPEPEEISLISIP